MIRPFYKINFIHCTCGKDFYVGLENRLSDTLWEMSFDSQLGEEEDYQCPHCKMEYQLDIQVQKTIELTHAELTTMGQSIVTDNGISLSLNILKGSMIGDKANYQDEFDDQPTDFPDGKYIVDAKEYTVSKGIVTNYWSTPDANQMGLFADNLEEVLL